MMRRLRNIWLVAAFDFFESIRSRKAIALLLLYVAGSLGATAIFLRVLKTVEDTLADTLHVSRTEGAGTMTHAMLESEDFRDFVSVWVGDKDLAEAIITLPPMVLFYAGLALTFIPLLAILSSCDSVSYEVSTGSCRFALFRTDRLSWALGKLGGQAALMTAGLLAGALSAWILGAFFLTGFQPAASAWWMLRMCGRVWFYGFAYLGLALGASQMTRSVNWSRAIALLTWFALAAGGAFLGADPIVKFAPTILPTVRQLFPNGHRLDLWRPDLLDRLPALVMLTALGALYFSIGYWRFARRDG